MGRTVSLHFIFLNFHRWLLRCADQRLRIPGPPAVSPTQTFPGQSPCRIWHRERFAAFFLRFIPTSTGLCRACPVTIFTILCTDFPGSTPILRFLLGRLFTRFFIFAILFLEMLDAD